MNKEQALNILINVAHLAQNEGCLKLNDAVTVANAISILSQKEPTVAPDLKKAIDKIKKEETKA